MKGFSGYKTNSSEPQLQTVKNKNNTFVKKITNENINAMTNLKMARMSLNSSGDSSGSSTGGIDDDNPLHLYHGWYPLKEDYFKLCGTWYTTEWCDNVNVYLILKSGSTSLNVVWYYGNYNSGYTYSSGCHVKYGSSYYKCIKDHRDEGAKYPTNSTYWSKVTLNNIDDFSESDDAWAEYSVPIITSTLDYVDKVTCGEGNLYESLMYDHDNCYCFLYASYEYGGECWYSYVYKFEKTSFYRLETTPSMSYDSNTNKISVSSSYSGKYLLEYYIPNYNPLGYSEQIRNQFFLSGIANLEYGNSNYYYLKNQEFNRWEKNKTYTVGIRYLDTKNRSTMYSVINDAIWEVNQIMNEFGITLQKKATTSYANTTGDITIICGSHEDLWGWQPSFEDGWYGGTWETTSNNGYITGATIKLRNDGEFHQTFAGVALEELLQCMGVGYDQIEYIENTIHSEFIYRNKYDYIPENDKRLLRIAYSDYIEAGMDSIGIANGVNPTNGATIVTNGQKLDFLKSNTRYSLKLFVVNSSGKISYPNSISITTEDLIPSNLNVTRINGGFTFSWTGTPMASRYRIKLIRKYDNYETTKTTSSTSVSFTGLQYGVTYQVYVQAYNNYYTGDYQFGYDCTTTPAQPRATASVNSSGVITVDWYLYDEDSNISKVWINLYDENSSCLQERAAYNVTSGKMSFNAVGDGTYYIRLRSVFSISGSDLVCVDSSGNGYTYTLSINVSTKPKPWSWTTSNGNATTTQTKNAYTAVNNKGYVTDFSYLVWNDFVEKVKEFLAYVGISSSAIGTTSLGVSSSTTYSALANKAKVTSSDKDITANRFNYIRYCIDAMNSTGIGKVYQDDIIYGSYFITMARKLNEV